MNFTYDMCTGGRKCGHTVVVGAIFHRKMHKIKQITAFLATWMEI